MDPAARSIPTTAGHGRSVQNEIQCVSCGQSFIREADVGDMQAQNPNEATAVVEDPEDRPTNDAEGSGFTDWKQRRDAASKKMGEKMLQVSPPP